MFKHNEDHRGVLTRLALTALIGVALVASPAVAQEIGASKIAIIDVQRLMMESIAGQEALAQLKDLRDQKQAEGAAKQSQVENLQARLQEGRLSLSEDRLREMEQELEAEILALRRFGDDAERELEASRVETLESIQNEVMPLINDIGAELGLTYIFDKFRSGLLYAEDHTDITDSVLQRFDEKVAAAEGN